MANGRFPPGYEERMKEDHLEFVISKAVGKSVGKAIEGNSLINVNPIWRATGIDNNDCRVTVEPITLHFHISVNVIMGDNVINNTTKNIMVGNEKKRKFKPEK